MTEFRVQPRSSAEDAIEQELFRAELAALGDEMALTIYRTSYSGVLKNIMDYSAAICDAEGRLAAQGLSVPGHLCSIPVALEAAMRAYADNIRPGDVLAVNDPYEGGMHLPDIFLFRPIYVAGERIAWAATICHHTDVGGRVPGSNASDSTEIFAEGLRIPPLKLYREGVADESLFRIIEKNVRVPARVLGDLRAQLAACEIAARGMASLVARHGAEEVKRQIAATMDYSERLTRLSLAALPDGEASFRDWIDDDQIDAGKPIPLLCTIRKQGDAMEIDWTGSSPQVKGAINNTWSYTAAASFTAVKSVLGAEAPNNDGVFRAIRVIAPPGTIANALPPAACAARGLTGFRMLDCCLGALAALYPARVPAASEGGNTGITIGGYDRERQPFIYVDFLSGSWGGRPWADGLEGNTNMFANMASFPIEVIEADNPIEVLAWRIVPDSGGAGKYRGGMALERSWRMLAEEGILQVRSDRVTHRPYGLSGGLPGTPSENLLDPGSGHERRLPGKFTTTLRRGEVFRHRLAGAGGWGDPLTRDFALVAEDLAEGLLSVEAAEHDYGVVASGDPPTIDRTASEALRRRRCAARGAAG